MMGLVLAPASGQACCMLSSRTPQCTPSSCNPFTCFSKPLHLGGAEAVDVRPHSTMAPRLHVSMGPSSRVSHSLLAAGAGTAPSAVLTGSDRLAHRGPLVLVRGAEAEPPPPPSRLSRP